MRTALHLAVLIALCVCLFTGSAAGSRLQGETCDGQPATVVGTSGPDTIQGTSEKDVMVGLDGDDTLLGMGGDDLLCGNDGADTITGGVGNDGLSGGGGTDRVDAGPGIDAVEGGAGNDMLAGGDGADIALYAGSGAAVQVDLGAGTATGADIGSDSLAGFEAVFGSAFDDTISGDDGDNVFAPGDGNDRVEGRGDRDLLVLGGGPTITADLQSTHVSGEGEDVVTGVQDVVAPEGGRLLGDFGSNYLSSTLSGKADGATSQLDGRVGGDILVGGTGNDQLEGGPGPDSLDGGPGGDSIGGGDGPYDQVLYSYSPLPVRVDLATGSGDGFFGTDMLSRIEGVHGSDFDDSLAGGPGSDALYGGAGNDTLTGGGGGDLLNGESGSDAVSGGGGSDYCIEGERAASCEIRDASRALAFAGAGSKPGTALDLRSRARIRLPSLVAYEAPGLASLAGALVDRAARVGSVSLHDVRYAPGVPKCVRAGKKHVAKIDPPQSVPLSAGANVDDRVTWRVSLFKGARRVGATRADAAVGGPRALAGALAWHDVAGRTFRTYQRPITGKGRYRLSASVTWESGASVSGPIKVFFLEPGTNAKRYAPYCPFGR